MRTKTLVIVALVAFAAGGTCPSDVTATKQSVNEAKAAGLSP